MPQTILTIAAEVFPANLGRLKDRIRDLTQAIETSADRPTTAYAQLGTLVPSLHFASMMVFEDERYDPLLTVELNVDGDLGPFLPQLDVPVLQPHLRAMIACCKRPNDPEGAALYDAITKPGSKLSLAPLLERLVIRPAVFHQGNRGLDRARILRESALFDDIQRALDDPALVRTQSAPQLHTLLRQRMLTTHPWLCEPDAPRIGDAETRMDEWRFVGFLLAIALALLLPGMILARFVPPWIGGLVCLVAALLVSLRVFGVWMRGRSRLVAIAAAGAVVAALALAPWHIGSPVLGAILRVVEVVASGICGLVLVVVLIAWRLRRLEDTDDVHEDPRTSPEKLARIAAGEDQVAQNHMGSLVHLKPGALRAVLLRLGLRGLGLLLRWKATDGFLASMRTIHFAHWAVVGNGSRLLFFSNFDSSWESYLDDFIEKAHSGLTLAWTNGVGFPRTRFLVGDGATNGRLFKAWARHSMTENLFWFSAYPALSVNQIERQFRVAEGLRRPTLSQTEALAWARDL